MDMKNPARYEPMHKKVMSKVLEDTNQGTPSQGDSFSFPFFGNVGSPLMATLNILGLNVALQVWFCTTQNVPNSLDASQISTLYQGHRMYVDPLSFEPVKPTPFSPSSGESLDASNHTLKRNMKRNIKNKMSPTSISHVGDLDPTYASHTGGKKPTTESYVGYLHPISSSHAGGKKPTIVNHARRKSPVTSSHTNISSPTFVDHVGYLSTTTVTHVEDKQPTTASHAGGGILITTSHTRKMPPTSASHVGDQHLASSSHAGSNPSTDATHVGGIDIV
jgi:hypothetical protein